MSDACIWTCQRKRIAHLDSRSRKLNRHRLWKYTPEAAVGRFLIDCRVTDDGHLPALGQNRGATGIVSVGVDDGRDGFLTYRLYFLEDCRTFGGIKPSVVSVVRTFGTTGGVD